MTDGVISPCHRCNRKIYNVWCFANGNYFHPQCFTCAICDNTIKPSTKEFSTKCMEIYCNACYSKHFDNLSEEKVSDFSFHYSSLLDPLELHATTDSETSDQPTRQLEEIVSLTKTLIAKQNEDEDEESLNETISFTKVLITEQNEGKDEEPLNETISFTKTLTVEQKEDEETLSKTTSLTKALIAKPNEEDKDKDEDASSACSAPSEDDVPGILLEIESTSMQELPKTQIITLSPSALLNSDKDSGLTSKTCSETFPDQVASTVFTLQRKRSCSRIPVRLQSLQSVPAIVIVTPHTIEKRRHSDSQRGRQPGPLSSNKVPFSSISTSRPKFQMPSMYAHIDKDRKLNEIRPNTSSKGIPIKADHDALDSQTKLLKSLVVERNSLSSISPSSSLSQRNSSHQQAQKLAKPNHKTNRMSPNDKVHRPSPLPLTPKDFQSIKSNTLRRTPSCDDSKLKKFVEMCEHQSSRRRLRDTSINLRQVVAPGLPTRQELLSSKCCKKEFHDGIMDNGTVVGLKKMALPDDSATDDISRTNSPNDRSCMDKAVCNESSQAVAITQSVVVKLLECPICFDSMLTRGGGTTYNNAVTACGHIFHRKCIDNWLNVKGNRRCPICTKLCLPATILQVFLEDNVATHGNVSRECITNNDAEADSRLECLQAKCNLLSAQYEALLQDHKGSSSNSAIIASLRSAYEIECRNRLELQWEHRRLQLDIQEAKSSTSNSLHGDNTNSLSIEVKHED